MRRWVLFAGVAMLVWPTAAWCAVELTPQQRADAAAAGNAYIACLRDQALDLDDDASDANTIAEAALDGCADSYRAYVRLSNIGDEQMIAELAFRQPQPKGPALRVVLKQRRALTIKALTAKPAH